MKRFYLLFVLFILTNFSFPVKPITLLDIAKPDSILVDSHRLYITEGASIYVYSLKDFSLEKKFGKAGEGPQEFKLASYGVRGLNLDVQPDALLVTSVGKLSIFTCEGKFKKEMRAPFNFFGNLYQGLGHRFVGMGSAQDEQKNYITADIYDAELNKVKEVCRWESFYKPGKGTRVFDDPIIFQTAGDEVIVIADGKDFRMNVFDGNGKKLYSIQHEYERIKISETYKEEVIKFFKTDPTTKNVFHLIQPILFHEYLPAIRTFFVKDKNIYVLTYKRKDQKAEFFIFDLKGRLLNKLFLPLVAQTPLIYYPFNIKDGKLYQLVENEDQEEWELHIHEIK